MKKIIKLKESDLLRIIEGVVQEQSFFKKIKRKLGIEKPQIQIHPSMNPEFKKQIDFSNLSTDNTTPYVCKPNDSNCAQFINDVSDDLKYIGNAWNAYKVAPGQLVYSAFNNVDSSKVKQAQQMWDLIHKKGGGTEKGPYNKKIASFVNGIVPSKPNVNLQNGDLVGIFYPPSSHHEEAFYQGLSSDKNHGSNNLWGMNTHVGRVMVILDDVPIVFHNVGGNVQATPANLLRIAWVKRKK
jgi:hypothetical protein